MSKRTKKSKSQKKIFEIIIALIVIIVGGIFGYDYLSDYQGPDSGNPGNNGNQYEPLPIEGYYDGCQDLYGVDLKNKLNEILNTNFEPQNYGKAKTVLADADVDPNDETKVLTIYSRQSVSRKWEDGQWHREHVWPNSRLGLDRVDESDRNQASDLHNLRAIVQSVNSSRGNLPYVDGSGTHGRTGTGWYPGDADKGDVARICFYMMVMYPFLELVDDNLSEDHSYEPEGAKMAKLSVLLKWHLEDPVDDFERHRNDVIYQAQKNRNPFIDHPEFVAYIFEGAPESTSDNLSTTIGPQVYFYIVINDFRKREVLL